jgi:hypothetical protein
MESNCSFAQALLDSALERVRDPDTINARLVAAAAVDERAIRADGDRVRLNRLDDSKNSSRSSKSSAPQVSGKIKLDAIGSGTASQTWRQISSMASSSSSSGSQAGSVQAARPSSLGRIAPPCLHHLTHQLFHNDPSGKFAPGKGGAACKFEHY